MEDEILALKKQFNESQAYIQEVSSHLKKKDDAILQLMKQNEKIEQAQEKLQRKLDLFDELTTDVKGKRIQYSVKANLKSEILQNLIEEVCFQQHISKLDQKIQDVNFNLSQKMSQIQTDLVNVESFCNSNLGKVKDSMDILKDLEKNKNFSNNIHQKHDQFIDLIQKNDLKLNDLKSKCEALEAQVIRKVDLNDLGRITELTKDGFVGKQQLAVQLENLQQQLYNEIKRKADQSQFEQITQKLETKLESVKSSVRSQPKSFPSTVVKVINENKQKEKEKSKDQEVPQPQKIEEIKVLEVIKEVPVINNEVKEELMKKIDEVKNSVTKQSEEFNNQIIDYQSQIMNLKSNFDGKIKHVQSLISAIQTSATEAVKKSRDVENYVLENMLTKEFIREFQKKINEKVDTFDKGYTETIEKLTQISNRANDSLGDLAIRLKLIPTREELIQRLEFVQAVSIDNQTIKMDISKIMDLIRKQDEFFLLKANKIDLKLIEEEIDAIKKKEPDFIVMQCEQNVTQIKDEVKECQQEIIDFRAEIIKMLNFSIFEEGELESHQERNKQKLNYTNIANNRVTHTPIKQLQQTQKQLHQTPLQQSVQQKQNRSKTLSTQNHKDSVHLSKVQNDKDSQVGNEDENQETGRNIFPWVEQIRHGIFDTYKVYDVLYTKANHSQVQELFDKKANKMIVGKLMDIVNNMKKQLVYLVVGQNQLIRTIRNTSDQSGQSQSTKEENRHKREIELQSLLRQNTKLLVWISSQDLEQDQAFVKKLKEKNAITVDFNMMEQMVEEVFQRYQQLNKLYLKQPNVKYTQEEIKLLDNFVRDIMPNRQLSLDELHNNEANTDLNEPDYDDFITETMQSQHVKSSKKLLEKSSTIVTIQQTQEQLIQEDGKTEPIQQRQKEFNKQVSILNDNSSFIKVQGNDDASTITKNNKSRVRIDLSDQKAKMNKSQQFSQTSNQNEQQGNLFLRSIQKDTQLLKDSLNTLITKDGYTKIYISPEEAEQIKKEQNYLKSSSSFISKKASTVSTARTAKKLSINNQFTSTESQESLQYFDLLASQNSKTQEQKLYNSNIVVQNIKKRDSYKKQKSLNKQNGVGMKLNLTSHIQRNIGMNESSIDLNQQSYTDSLTQQSLDFSTTYSRKNKNQASFSLSGKKHQISSSENNTPRDAHFLSKSLKQSSKKLNDTTYDITDY